ncbi:AAA family ATPase [Microcoleus sp. FACHB-831]|uniref:bifunctional aminoglycoside phosphotransferase/ATP-binding protein n=1 Tax=Microcoleus sp. FACHB-831 TaxID=2692827 RepID=UPI0016896225|nr:AAA family ATPase [Microcoleus sp. FACHB-831]MBD1923061.1 AAA family ATPase [Microcoleus sp. FACHB-831]
MTDTALPPLIQQMLQPGFYPHSVTEPIGLIQTHVSYVLLTGDYVYKVKKPMNFGFLNYSTLELRQHFCAEEMRLNQRGAAEIYLEILPITQTGKQYHLGGTGEPVEYALKMTQFPQDGLFSAMFEQGKLTETHMQELGRVVAKFHEKAEINDYIRSFGKVSQVRDAIDENYRQTEKYIGGPQTQTQYEETRKYTDEVFAKNEDIFNSRIENNWFRECHGDLHIRNICLWQDKILLFDCIEFNEPFRFVDVMFDIAYAVMDMDARSRPDLGNAYLNTYVEQMGDWEGLQVLPLYLSRQAYVRAKVTSFLLDDPAVPPDEKEAAAKTAAQYYKLAWEYTQPKQGRLILMSGLSGSGKSTVAAQLARKIGAIHMRSDAVRKHLGGVPLAEKGGAELYSAEMTQKTYNRLLELGIKLASQGWTVILDAKYDRQQLRGDAIAKCQSHNLTPQILHCTAPDQVLRDRLSSRAGDVSDATADLLAAQQAAAEPFTQAEQTYVTTIDTTKDWQPQFQF